MVGGHDLVTRVICAREIKVIPEMHERHKDGRIAVLGISLDGEAGLSEAWGFFGGTWCRIPKSRWRAPTLWREFFKDRTGRRLPRNTHVHGVRAGVTLTALQVGPVPPEAIENSSGSKTTRPRVVMTSEYRKGFWLTLGGVLAFTPDALLIRLTAVDTFTLRLVEDLSLGV